MRNHDNSDRAQKLKYLTSLKFKSFILSSKMSKIASNLKVLKSCTKI